MSGKRSDAVIERDFALLEGAAKIGARCPQSWPHGPIRTGSIAALIDQGRIRSEVYRHNYRVVTILKGEHRGKSTLRPPELGEPYRVNGRYVGLRGGATVRGF